MANGGVFIAVEGIDGAGKTTQVNLLADALRRGGETVVTSKEPTTGEWGQKIRASAMTGRLSPEEELEAFIRDREEHLEHTVLPSLEDGKVVILDRYFYSTIAYQGPRLGDVERLDRDVRALAETPDLVILLDVDPALSLVRIKQRDGAPNAFEQVDALREVRKVFNQLARMDPVIRTFDGSHSVEALSEEILQVVVDETMREKRCAVSHGCQDVTHCTYKMTGTCAWWQLRQDLLPGGEPSAVAG